MLIKIYNLPNNTHYSDVKALIQEKCGLFQLILDNLVSVGQTKCVTVGLVEESDAAILVRKINGLHVQGLQLYVEDIRKQQELDQPYRSSDQQIPSLDNSSSFMYNHSPMMSAPPPVNMPLPLMGMCYVPPNNVMAFAAQNQYIPEQEAITYPNPAGVRSNWSSHNFGFETPGSVAYVKNSDDWRQNSQFQESTSRNFSEQKNRKNSSAVQKNKWDNEYSGTSQSLNSRGRDSDHSRWTPRGSESDLGQQSRYENSQNGEFDYERRYNSSNDRTRSFNQSNMSRERSPHDYDSNRDFNRKDTRNRSTFRSSASNNEFEHGNQSSNMDQEVSPWGVNPNASDNSFGSRARSTDETFDRYQSSLISENYSVRPNKYGNRDNPQRGHYGNQDSLHREQDNNQGRTQREQGSIRDRPQRDQGSSRDIIQREQGSNRDRPQRDQGSSRDILQGEQGSNRDRQQRGQYGNQDGPQRGQYGNRDKPQQGQDTNYARSQRGQGNYQDRPQGQYSNQDNSQRGQFGTAFQRQQTIPNKRARQETQESFDHRHNQEINSFSTDRLRKETELAAKRPRLLNDRNFPQQTKIVPKKAKKKSNNKEDFSYLVRRNQNMRGEGVSILAKEILKNANANSVGHDIFVKLKMAIRTRVDMLIGDKLMHTKEDVQNIYRKKFTKNDDSSFYHSVLDRIAEDTGARKSGTPTNLNFPRQRKVIDITSKKPPQETEAAPKVPQAGPYQPSVIAPAMQKFSGELKSNPLTAAPSSIIPKYPQGDKKLYNKIKQLQKLEMSDDNLYELPPLEDAALQRELEDIKTAALIPWSENYTDTVKIVVEKLNGEIWDDIKKSVKLHATKRLLDVRTSLQVRVFGRPRAAALTAFLRDFGVVALRKCERAAMYVVTCDRYENFDRLCALPPTSVGGTVVTFKPLGLLGPKKSFRERLLEQKSKKKTGQIVSTTNKDIHDEHDDEINELMEEQDNDEYQIVDQENSVEDLKDNHENKIKHEIDDQENDIKHLKDGETGYHVKCEIDKQENVGDRTNDQGNDVGDFKHDQRNYIKQETNVDGENNYIDNNENAEPNIKINDPIDKKYNVIIKHELACGDHNLDHTEPPKNHNDEVLETANRDEENHGDDNYETGQQFDADFDIDNVDLNDLEDY